MTHHSLEQWADFARGRAPGELVDEMQRKLDQGCAECAQALEVCRSVLEVASREADFEPPESSVRCAKRLFGIVRTEKAESLALRVARQVFSASAELLPAGLRSGGDSTSHLLFEGGNWMLDLRLKLQAGYNQISVAGQILDTSQPDRVYTTSTVAVLRGREELSRAKTNQFGEFQLQFYSGGMTIITVAAERESLLVFALPESITP